MQFDTLDDIRAFCRDLPGVTSGQRRLLPSGSKPGATGSPRPSRRLSGSRAGRLANCRGG